MNYFKKFGDISNVSTLVKEKMAAIQYKKESDAKKAVDYEGKPFDLPSLILYIAAEGEASVNKDKSLPVNKKPEDSSKMVIESTGNDKKGSFDQKEGYKNFNNYHYNNPQNPNFNPLEYQDQYMMHNKYYGGQYQPHNNQYNAQYHPNMPKQNIFSQSKSANASPMNVPSNQFKNFLPNDAEKKPSADPSVHPNQVQSEPIKLEQRQKEQQARMQKMKFIEDRKEAEKTKKILLQNLTQQIQLLLDFKSRESDEKMKIVIQERIRKVNTEMKEVNSVAGLDHVKAKYGDEMTKSLDATLRVKKRDTDDEESWKKFLDYSTCTKIFMEFGKIDGMTINKDGRTVLIKYASLSSAAKAFDSLMQMGNDISFISHVFQHLAEAKLERGPE